MSSRRDHPTHATGAHRARPARRFQPSERSGKTAGGQAWDSRAPAGRAAQRAAAAQRSVSGTAGVGGTGRAAGSGGERGVSGAAGRPVAGDRAPVGGDRREAGRLDATSLSMLRYGPYLDGLFTYCLSVMCEHDAAVTALGEALVLAERQHERDRSPAQRGLRRPWLYSLVRWTCLRRLAERARREGGGDAVPAIAPHLSDAARTQRRRELAALAWPEAAGTSPEQREALELAVRHGLPAAEVAAVLALAPEATSALLSHAACEVERTRAALAVVESGGCAAVARLGGDDQLLLGAAFRRELLRHVDECSECRHAAERAMAGVSWPGTAPAGTAELAVLEAPRPAVEAAVLAVRRARCQHNPRFDRAGFPVTEKDRSARRDRLRSRAITTTVVATVIAAPVLALWAAYRGAPFTGESDGAGVSASEREQRAEVTNAPYENAVQEGPHGGHTGRHKGAGPHGGKGGHHRSAHPGGGRGSASDAASGGDGHGSGTGSGQLTVDARPTGDATLIRLTDSGSSPVRWSADSDAPWLRLSRTSGVLRPGESITLRVTVDRAREPRRPWAAHITVAPSGAVVTIQGHGHASPPPPSSDDPGTPPPSQQPTTPPPSHDPSPSSPPDDDPSSPSGPPPSDSDSPSS